MYIVDYIDLLVNDKDVMSQENYDKLKQIIQDTERQIKAEKAYLNMHEQLEEHKREDKTKVKI
jgi:hypothetical protein